MCLKSDRKYSSSFFNNCLKALVVLENDWHAVSGICFLRFNICFPTTTTQLQPLRYAAATHLLGLLQLPPP
eukprot:m.102771 g.102771  ORF g.102771 m.102771 type:complete len:71 (+) comp14126_c0_seq1:2004-2216(+)